MAKKSNRAVTRDAAEAAVRTLLRWAGEDPRREGLRDTPKRVVNAYGDWFSGYTTDPSEYLRRTFEEVEGYDEMVVLRDIAFESFCEHHMAPIIGRAHVGYLPTDRVVGISKLARVVDGFSRRFQVQEKLTAQIAACINEVLKPRGVGVVIDAVHQCMTTRGVHKRGVSMVTSKMLGAFRKDASTRAEFLRFIDIEGKGCADPLRSCACARRRPPADRRNAGARRNEFDRKAILMPLARLQRADPDDLAGDLLALFVRDRHDDAVLAASLAAGVLDRALDAHRRRPGRWARTLAAALNRR